MTGELKPCRKHSLKGCLARYMDPKAFVDRVPDRVKFTCPEVGRVAHEKLKFRRDIALKRAAASIRFFSKPENHALLPNTRTDTNSDLLEAASEAAEIVERYAGFIRSVRADDLEMHPYLPEVERIAEDARAAISKHRALIEGNGNG